jgi:hypothetical protein
MLYVSQIGSSMPTYLSDCGNDRLIPCKTGVVGSIYVMGFAETYQAILNFLKTSLGLRVSNLDVGNGHGFFNAIGVCEFPISHLATLHEVLVFSKYFYFFCEPCQSDR